MGYSVVSQTITNFFMFFGTSVLKVNGTLIGLAIALGTVWDALTDPVVGYMCDNKKLGIFGFRNGYMLIGVIGVAVVNLFIWCVPNGLSVGVKFVWIAISLILNETFCTLFSTPYGALSSDMVTEYNERTVIQVYKTVFFILGMILPSVLLNIFLPNTPEFPQGQLNPLGYRNIAIFSSFVMLVSGLICVFGTLKFSKKEQKNKQSKFSFKLLFSDFLFCLKNKQQRVVILGYCLSMVSAAILTSVGLHFFTYCFSYSSSQITILLSSLLIAMVVSQPFWYRLSLKEDKKPALLTGLLLAIFGVTMVMLTYIFKLELINYSFYIIVVSIFLIGFGCGTLYSLPASMYMDVVDYVTENLSADKSAIFQSVLTFSYNISNAVALFLIGVLLDIIKFNPNLNYQTRPTQTGIAVILFVGVLISLIGSFCLFKNYKLKQKHFSNKN